MRDVLEENGGKLRPPAVIAMMVASVLSIAVGYNALFAQQGIHRQLARNDAPAAKTRIDVVAGQPAENAITLRYDPGVEAVQRQLQAAGFYAGGVDGVAGKRTKAAIESYQSSTGLEVTGEVSPELIEHIRYTVEIARAAEFTGATSDPQTDAPDERSVRLVQTALAELGYVPGEVTGEMSAATESAIFAFEKDRGLPQTGRISKTLLSELGEPGGEAAATTPQ
jgi:peptidoglycan hydrolase-like protein with peptidoglycan-binding domain